jgi:hypothetical protein
MEELDLGGDLTYSERPIKILDIAERVTCSKVSRCARYSEVTTRKTKLPGNTKKNSEQIIPTYSQALPECQGDILLRGVGL